MMNIKFNTLEISEVGDLQPADMCVINGRRFRHASESAVPDYSLIGFDLLDIGLNLIGKDIEDRERYINACADAAKLCFEVDSLKSSMMELYKRLEGMEE